VTVKVSVTDRDNGAKKKIKEFLAATKRVSVGIHGDATGEYEDDGSTVLDIGAIHEFGIGVPRRSFIADWVDQKQTEIKSKIKTLAVHYARGRLTLDQALDQLGQWAVGSIQERISARIPPPLAQSTIDRKGSSVPLIDTNVLRSSISYKIDGKAR
jgi:hypothetical protein